MISKQAVLSAQQIPDWIREEYPVFVAFVEAYYEYLELNSKIRSLQSSKDLDNSLDIFINAYKADLMHNIPNMENIDVREFLRNAKAFYTAKGSEASFRFLFRAMFGKEMTIYYPETDMLRASDGRWNQDYSIIVEVTEGNPFNLVGNKLYISLSDTRLVTRVKKISGDIHEIFFVNTGSFNNVLVDSVIYDPRTGVRGTIQAVFGSVAVLTKGTGFSEGQIFNIGVSESSNGKLRITKIDENGGIVSIKPIAFSLGTPSSTPDMTIYLESNQSQNVGGPPGSSTAALKISISPIAKYQGYYTASNGFLSDSVKLQDSYYYQIYSYVLKVDEQLSAYKSVVMSLLHPAGQEMFGEYIMSAEYDMSAAVNLMEKFAKINLQDIFYVSDSTITNFTKMLSDSVIISESKYLSISKQISDSVVLADSGNIYRVTPGDYDSYPTEQYFNPPEYYSQASQILIYSW